jgi:hypothetical protein
MAEDVVARERVAALERLLLLWRDETQRALDKFQDGVTARFTTVNEFRQALADLSGEMATRRELETFQEEYWRSHNELSKDLANLRSRVDSGPIELHEVARQAALETGRREGTHLIAGALYGLAGLMIGVITVVVIWLH